MMGVSSEGKPKEALYILTEIWRNHKSPLFPDAHSRDALLPAYQDLKRSLIRGGERRNSKGSNPTFDNLPDSKNKLVRLPNLVGGVELLAIVIKYPPIWEAELSELAGHLGQKPGLEVSQ